MVFVNYRTVRRHLLSLLNDILDLSKIEAGRLEIDIHDLELGPFLADIQSLMHMSTRDKKLRLSFSTNSDLPQVIRTDPTRLRQILLNLLGNAIKFTDRGHVEMRIGLTEDNGRTLIKFAIVDSGIGIRQDDIQKIFQPFAQARHENGRHYTGTGLGLAISRQWAKRLGGDIEATSRLGMGSTFMLTIDPGDLRGVTHSKLTIEHDVSQTGPLRQSYLRGRVLVVDDLPDIRKLVGYIIGQAGPSVDFARPY